MREKADAAAKDTRRQADDYSSTTRAKADEYSTSTRRRPTSTRGARRRRPTEQARKTVEEGDRRRAAAEAVVAELKTQRDDTVAEMERLRSELLVDDLEAHDAVGARAPQQRGSP